MKEDEEGFIYPIVNQDECRECGLCNKVCPELNVKRCKNEFNNVYVASNKDKQVLQKSSSGGIFYELAKNILTNGGVVYGAAFEENNILNHIEVSDINHLKKLLKSKYIQSNINDVYKKIKENIKNDKYVLFCGTPCQVSGLKKYLDKDYEKLILVDFICHGVPNQKLFQKYLDDIRTFCNETSQIKKIDFRSKDLNWEKFGMKIEFESGKIYSNDGNTDYWIKSFLQDIMLRPSCYNCANKGIDRNSDITLADAWGIEQYNSAFYNKQGTSLVVVHTLKGQNKIEEIKSCIMIDSVEEDFIKKHNVNTYYSAIADRRRKQFFKHINKGYGFKECVDKVIGIDFLTRVERKIKRKK